MMSVTIHKRSNHQSGGKSNRSLYIRYRIYTQRANRADYHYPKRLMGSLHNMHNNIKTEDILFTRPYWEEGIISKFFIPDSLNHINPRYYKLISHLTEYFDCVAIWEKRILPGSIHTINTFRIYGYYQDVYLAYHHISRIINNLESMRLNMQSEYRRIKINSRRRGNKQSGLTATQKASNLFYNALDNITLLTKELLDKREERPIIQNVLYSKRQDIYRAVKAHFKTNLKAYKYKGNMTLEKWVKASTCRVNKFVNKRIIQVNY